MLKAIEAKGPEKHCSDKTGLKLIDRIGRVTRVSRVNSSSLVPGDLAEIKSGICAHILAPDQMGISMDAIN